MIKAVIFDIDGVLFDSFDANLKFFQSLFTLAGHKPPAKEDYQPLVHLSMHDVIKVLTNASDEETKKIWELGRSDKVPSVDHLIRMPKGIKETILQLHKNYLLGIVTSRIKEKVYVAGLSELQHCFEVAIAYQDTMNHKPHPEPLLLACKKLDIKPQDAVYIGDTESDVIAGKAAGMKVVNYTKNKYKNADAHTYSFKELPKIIQKLA
ncbi:MAG TPA: HAD family hydrolase [Methylomirabilota bacterium]|nr:HAD family hydrolase [Methylomirabilota bacterium]